jgi:hypothetical protein
LAAHQIRRSRGFRFAGGRCYFGVSSIFSRWDFAANVIPAPAIFAAAFGVRGIILAEPYQ